MKVICLVFFLVLGCHLTAQVNCPFEKKIKIVLQDWKNKPILKTGHITFNIAGKEYRAIYNQADRTYLFDSLPAAKGILHIQCPGYESQKYVMRPQQEIIVQLGKTGCFYSVGDNGLLYPFGKEKSTYGIELSSIAGRDWLTIEKKILPVLDSMQLSLIYLSNPRKYTYLIYLKDNTHREPRVLIQELLKNELIAFAGEARIYPGEGTITPIDLEKSPPPPMGSEYYTSKGFFPNRLFIEFEKTYNLPDDETILQISSEEKKRILDTYGLEPDPGYGAVNFQRGYVQITESFPGTVNEVAKRLLLEPAVKKVSVPYTPFFPPEEPGH